MTKFLTLNGMGILLSEAGWHKTAILFFAAAIIGGIINFINAVAK